MKATKSGGKTDDGPLGPSNADLIRRLRRIEGQARGLQRMIAEGRPCSEIVTQLSALREAVNKVGVALIARHVASCLEDRNPPTDQEFEDDGSVRRERSGRLREAVQMFLRFS